MATKDITAAEFDNVISTNDIVILDFWADWCGPCKAFAPIFKQVSENHPDIVFAKVDTDAEQELAGHFQIRSIPTLMIFREQVMMFAQPGMLSAPQLEELIKNVRDVDMAKVHEEIAKQQQENA